MTEIDKNVLKEVENNQKVEVVVKRESENGTAELDLVRVFSNMGKKKRVYAWVLIICMLVGLSVPMLMAELKDKTESVSAVITFLYDGAKLEQAPDETPLDINYITSSYILQNAINRTCLSENITVSSLERNMGIERLLTENTRQNLEVMEKVINEGKTDYDAVRDVIYQYDGKYILTLDNGFSSDPEAKNKVFLKGDELSNLLNNVIESYNEYFYETYMDMTLPDNNLDSISIEDHDYIEKLDEMVTMLNSLSEYCHDKDKEDFYEIRSKKDGMSFRDIDDCIRLIKDIDIDYLYAYVFYNGIAKDKKSMMTKYEFQLKNSQRELNVVEGNIKNNKQLISEYKNDKITISMTDQGTTQVNSAVTDYYNKLIMSQADDYVKKAELGETIANLNDKITGFKTGSSSKSQKEYVESELDSLVNICKALYSLTEEHAEEIIDSDSYKSSYMSYIGAQYVGESFFSANNIKKAVIGIVVGVVAALAIWFMDGFIAEFKRGSAESEMKKKEEVQA